MRSYCSVYIEDFMANYSNGDWYMPDTILYPTFVFNNGIYVAISHAHEHTHVYI